MSSPAPQPRGQNPGRSPRLTPLALFIGALLTTSSALGVLAHRQYVTAELHFRATFAELAEVGQHMDVEQCITWVLEWKSRCAAARPMCEAAVPGLVEACLRASERSDYCDSIGPSSDTHWSFENCKRRGFGRRDHACAKAYLAVDAFCQHFDRVDLPAPSR